MFFFVLVSFIFSSTAMDRSEARLKSLDDAFKEALFAKSLRECLHIIGKQSDQQKKEQYCLSAACVFTDHPSWNAVVAKLDEALSHCGILHLAAKCDNRELLKKIIFLENYTKVCTKGGTALHWAAAANAVNSVSFLIEQKACTVDACDNMGCTAFHWAVMHNATSAMYVLKNSKAVLDAVDKRKMTAFHMAAAENALDAMTLLRELSVSSNQLCDLGRQPIHYAAYEGKCKALYFLKKIGVQISLHAISKAKTLLI